MPRKYKRECYRKIWVCQWHHTSNICAPKVHPSPVLYRQILGGGGSAFGTNHWEPYLFLEECQSSTKEAEEAFSEPIVLPTMGQHLPSFQFIFMICFSCDTAVSAGKKGYPEVTEASGMLSFPMEENNECDYDNNTDEMSIGWNEQVALGTILTKTNASRREKMKKTFLFSHTSNQRGEVILCPAGKVKPQRGLLTFERKRKETQAWEQGKWMIATHSGVMCKWPLGGRQLSMCWAVRCCDFGRR